MPKNETRESPNFCAIVFNLFKVGGYRYYSVFDILQHGECSISLLAECEKEELSNMESHFIEQYKDRCINKNKILKGIDMVRCDCGKIMKNSQLSFHLNTKSHKSMGNPCDLKGNTSTRNNT